MDCRGALGGDEVPRGVILRRPFGRLLLYLLPLTLSPSVLLITAVLLTDPSHTRDGNLTQTGREDRNVTGQCHDHPIVMYRTTGTLLRNAKPKGYCRMQTVNVSGVMLPLLLPRLLLLFLRP